MRRNFYNRHRRPQWPHFDNRGPEHYYDAYAERRRYADEYLGEREPQGYYNDSDIYEDEFDERDDHRGYYYGRPDDDRWPEDAFHRNRQQMQRTGEPRRWQRILRPFFDRPESRRGYPEDQHGHSYGRNIHERNGNRGYAQYPPHYREY